MEYLQFIALLLYGVSVVTGHESTGLSFELPDNERICFYEDYKGGRPHIFTYKVLRGGQMDVDVSVESPNGKILYKEVKQTTGTYTFDPSWGVFSFCFSNEFSTFTHKVVYFEIRPADTQPLAVEAGIKRPSANTQLEASMETLHKANTNVVEQQKQFRMRESQGRSQAEDLNHRVQWWSVGESIVILLTGLGQVFILRTFFANVHGISRRSKITPGLASIGLPNQEFIRA